MRARAQALQTRLLGASHTLCSQGIRGLKLSSPASHETPDNVAGDSSGSSIVGITRLHSVVSVQEGQNTFAAATVAFNPNGEQRGNVPCNAAAYHAAEVALLAVRGALGAQRHPSTLVAMASADLPRSAVQVLTEALVAAVEPGTPLVGCSSRLRLPDEARGGATGARAGAGAGGVHGEAGARGVSAVASANHAHLPYHVTLAAAHLPCHEVHAVHSETGSLPRLPYLTEALQGRRQPAFLLLSGTDSMAEELLARLQNIFPDSCIGAGVAAHPSGRTRKGLMLVGPGGISISGRTSSADGAGSITSGSTSEAGDAASVLGSEGRSWARAAPAATLPGAAAVAPRRGDVEGSLLTDPGEAATRGAGGPPSDLEGPFQRMLLNRDGRSLSAVAGTSTSASSNSSARSSRSVKPGASTEDAATSGDYASGENGGTGAGGGRRRRPPPSAAAVSTANPSASYGEDEQGDPAAPYVTVSGQVYDGGCALLAIYPRVPAPLGAVADRGVATATATAAEAAAAATMATATARPPAAASVSWRLEGPACDRMSRVVLGTDLLHHVALRGAALAAVTPPPTGPEPATPYPSAPDNPYYWWPATAILLPRMAVDPHLEAKKPPRDQDYDSDPNPDASFGKGRTHSSAHAEARHVSQTAAVRARAGGSGDSDDTYGSVKEAEEEEEDPRPSAAALTALNEGLVGLPLFPLDTVVLFPGQTIQLRIFEKRYRLLIRSCLEQGASFGLCSRGMGTTAVVRSYQCVQGGSSDIMVLLEGGVRFSYSLDDLAVQPASYGVNVAQRAEYVLDEAPIGEGDSAAMLAAAHSILDGIAGALEAVTAPSARHAARTFANALHFASGNAAADSIAAAATSSSAATKPGSSGSNGEQVGADGSGRSGDGGAAAQARAGAGAKAESDDALLAADVAEAKRALDADTASLLSLYLAPHIPVHLESLRREWFTSRSALWRLQQEASWLRANPRVCLAVASSVLRLPREHPLRVMLGLSSVAPVEGG